MSYAYQWKRCAADGTACVDVSGATSADYLLDAGGADEGYTFRCQVTDGVGATDLSDPWPPGGVQPAGTAATPVAVGTLLFSDEFDAPIDTAKWDVKNRVNPYSGTTFIPANVSVHDSLLDIVATKDAAGKWFGGEIQGLAPASQYSGPRYMEARAKMPAGFGTWPAPIWERDAPFGALAIENDVNEHLGKEPTKYHVTLHNGSSQQLGKSVDVGVDLSAGYHVYGAAVYATHVDYYFDGALVATITAAEAGFSAWPFTTTNMVALIDLDIGGAWAGSVLVAPPVHMLVDYIRVWALA